MKLRAVFLASLLALSGCQTKPLTALTYAEQQKMIVTILDRCHKAGVKAGTPEEKECFSQEVHAEQYQRSQNTVAIQNTGRALQAVGAGMAAAGANQRPAPVIYNQQQTVIFQQRQPTLSETLNANRRAQNY